ncbi:hypothetical protein [Nocardia sp. NPDC052566]|uniref:ATP dependent DNA ligase n=1 Tax=Nocardia sp. NPDC052566 TaxID=3364330 RepID=UPI0037C863D2
MTMELGWVRPRRGGVPNMPRTSSIKIGHLPRSWESATARPTSRHRPARHLEGIVVKELDSIYLPGVRSPVWIKVAFAKTTEVIVVGTLPSSSSRLRGEFGSLLIAAQNVDGELVLLGAVGSGISAAERRRLRPQLERLAIAESVVEDPPGWAASASWCYPALVGEVRYKERTSNGVLRQPVWVGLRWIAIRRVCGCHRTDAAGYRCAFAVGCRTAGGVANGVVPHCDIWSRSVVDGISVGRDDRAAATAALSARSMWSRSGMEPNRISSRHQRPSRCARVSRRSRARNGQ